MRNRKKTIYHRIIIVLIIASIFIRSLSILSYSVSADLSEKDLENLRSILNEAKQKRPLYGSQQYITEYKNDVRLEPIPQSSIPRKKYDKAAEERKAAIAYLGVIAVEKGLDTKQLSAEEIEDIKQLEDTIKILEEINKQIEKDEKNKEKNNTDKEISTNDKISIGVGSFNTAYGFRLDNYVKIIDQKANDVYEKSFKSIYSEIVGDITNAEKAKRAVELEKASGRIRFRETELEKAKLDKAEYLSNNLKRKNTVIDKLNDNIKYREGNLRGAQGQYDKLGRDITKGAEDKAGGIAKNFAENNKASITKMARAAKVIGVIMNAFVMFLDAKDLIKGDMASKTTGNSEWVNAERAAVIVDGLMAALGIVAITAGKTVAVGATTTTVVTVLETTVTVSVAPWLVALWLGTILLTHTEPGQDILKGFFDWSTNTGLSIYDKLVGNKFGVDNMGEKMIEHINDRSYMERLLEEIEKKNRGRTKTANGVGALKPNIYLYPEEQTDIVVSFEHPELLTTVIPDYSGNWSVTAEPDGTLHSEDGQDYSYLFYESETQPFFFGNKEGWLIKADERAERYTEILTEYGFNEKEIADFVEFWVDKLPEGVDYMMYPNDTEIIDRAMPVSFSTEPDSIFRIWFTFEVYDDQEVPEPEVEEFIRDGFTVVEWGGVILN